MILRLCTVLLMIFLIGCAAYKELKPKPDISFIENGYIELKNDEDKFELDKDKKYFIQFPQAVNENTYLTLSFQVKPQLNTYLTRAFDDGKGLIIKIEDLGANSKHLSVYPLDKTVPLFFWVIERVSQDLVLDLEYRYIAAWRYKFETTHEKYENILAENSHGRAIFDAIGTSITASEIDYLGEKNSVEKKYDTIQKVKDQLNKIEEIFPSDILNSSDQSYLTYVAFKKKIETELKFQSDYLYLLSIIGSASDKNLEIAQFIPKIPEYLSFLNTPQRYPEPVFTEAKNVFAKRLPEITPFLEKTLRKKTDIKSIPFDTESIDAVYTACQMTPPPNFETISEFINLFNKKNNGLNEVENKLKTLRESVEAGNSWPANTVYSDAKVRLSKIRYTLPGSDVQDFGKYRSYACAALLSKTIENKRDELLSLESQYTRAEQLVPQINLLKNQGKYREILRMLRRNMDISFLISQYDDIDQLSLTQQQLSIRQSLRQRAWADAETKIRDLHLDQDFLNLRKIGSKKSVLVASVEDSLFNSVKQISRSNALAFIGRHKTTTTGVDALYDSLAFSPVHQISFASPGQPELNRRSKVINDQMQFLKTQSFPETAIETLYNQFSADINTNGVVLARAIVSHGNKYSGSDKKIKNLVAECDPTAAKWITQPKTYRRIYALPITSSQQGENVYLVKLNLQIPSEAEFPVFDVNIRLPIDLARSAGTQQWYDEMQFNTKLLKNEGRFSISAPTPDNNYESQITPLQVNKTGNNILEIKFKHNSFKVFEVSTMAQKPIMKKN